MVSRLPNSSAWVSAAGATIRAVRPSARHEAPEPRPRVREVPHDRHEVDQQRVELLDRAVEVGPAAGEGVAELGQVALRGRARLVVERVEDLVELDRLAASRCAAGSSRRPAKPWLEVPLVISTYFRPSAERGRMSTVESTGSGLTVVSSLSVSTRADRAVLGGDRGDVGHRADARAADAHVVALDQVGRVGDLGLELVGRDERQARVGVVGQEDGDDDHERRRGADEHRVGGDGGRAAAHQPSPPSR